jgi:WXG100 family type VII secretion target
MGGVDADPDALRMLADRLDRAEESLTRVQSNLDAGHESLAATWRDERYRAFEEVFRESSPRLRQLASEMSRTAQYLRRKAGPLDDFLSRGSYR